MSSQNMFYKLYSKKESEELGGIVNNDDYTSDAKLCAISILRERNICIDDLIPLEQDLIEKRDERIGSEFSQAKYNTGFDRFLSLIIDGIVLSFIGWFFNVFNGIESVILIGLIHLVQLSLPYLYSIILHGYCGQTFGKMAMNVKIYDKTEKKPITYKQAVIRDIVPMSILVILQLLSYFINPNDLGVLIYVSFVMTFLLISWSILEIVTMLFDSKKRALHDYIAGTVVLKVRG